MKTLLTQSEWQRLEEIFEQASQLEDAAREIYLNRVGEESAEMKARVEALLATCGIRTQAGEILGRAAANFGAAELPQVGARLGNYRITALIGRGGMGIVYRAVRDDESFEKEVAIKVVSLSLASSEIRQRFLRERQILARLEHPNIARILDGGNTAAGEPFLVMELIEGMPVDQYAEAHKLSAQARVRLFLQIVRAVENAHRYLIVHRDIKPDNILVTSDGIPKLLDFGIAKALDPTGMNLAAGKTLDATQLLTPDYASPEQLRGGDITTSTDVYQLGVLFYRLMTGRKPFVAKTGSFAEMERLICEVQPDAPRVDRDLDKVILHAMEKQPERRYASAGEFAQDLERYLNGFPVEAAAISRIHVLRKFVERHRVAVMAAMMAVGILFASVIILLIQQHRVQRERMAAEQVSESLAAILSRADPAQAGGRQISSEELLNAGVRSLENAPELDPASRDRLLTTLGDAYLNQSSYDRAYNLYSQSLELRNHLYGNQSAQSAAILFELADLDLRKENYQRAFIDADRWFASIAPFENRKDAQAYEAFRLRAQLDRYRNQLEQSVVDSQKAVEIAREFREEDPSKLVTAELTLGALEISAGKWAESERSLRAARDQLGPQERISSQQIIDLGEIETRLGEVLALEGRYQEAQPLLRKALLTRLKVLGFVHDSTGSTEARLGYVLAQTGHFKEAEEMGRNALRSREAHNGREYRNYGIDAAMLGETYLKERKFKEAEEMFAINLRLCKSHLGEDNFFYARALNQMGQLQLAEGNTDEAGGDLERAYQLELRLGAPHSPYLAEDLFDLGRWAAARRDLPAARHYFQQAIALYDSLGLAQIPAALAARKANSLIR